MSEHSPRDTDDQLRRLLGEPEAGDDQLMADPDLRRVVESLTAAGAHEHLDSPPIGMWDAIAAGAGLSAAATVENSADPSDEPLAPVVPIRRSAPPWWLGAAAAVVIVLVVAVGALALATGGGDDETKLASAELEVLLPVEATGSAQLVQVADTDDLNLVVDVAGLDTIDGFYEVWLLTPEVDGLVSLGPLRSDGRYQLPSGLDPTEFSVVDISIEPHDGDPTHSGDSILRGGLVEA